MQPRAILVGNSDGIGLATTKRLLSKGWNVIGLSRSESPITSPKYRHRIVDVSGGTYSKLIDELGASDRIDLCIYFAAIGELLNPLDMSAEARVIDVNFTSMVRTVSGVVPHMVKRGHGQFIGISSMADELTSADAPSYYASKAGFSSYLQSLALALRPKGVHITNIRFGFVDTKMAKGDHKPFLMSVEKAVDHVEHCIARKPARYSAPWIMIPLIKGFKLVMKLRGG
jgi:short-subunit dehydrogenase